MCFQEANGVKSRGLAARQTLWGHKCKTNRMKTSLKPSEHMKARRRWSWVRGAEQTLGTPFDPPMRRTCLCRSPTSYGSRFPRELRFLCFTTQSSTAATPALRSQLPPKQCRFFTRLRRSHSRQSRGFTQIPPRACEKCDGSLCNQMSRCLDMTHHDQWRSSLGVQ